MPKNRLSLIRISPYKDDSQFIFSKYYSNNCYLGLVSSFSENVIFPKTDFGNFS